MSCFSFLLTSPVRSPNQVQTRLQNCQALVPNPQIYGSDTKITWAKQILPGGQQYQEHGAKAKEKVGGAMPCRALFHFRMSVNVSEVTSYRF